MTSTDSNPAGVMVVGAQGRMGLEVRRALEDEVLREGPEVAHVPGRVRREARAPPEGLDVEEQHGELADRLAVLLEDRAEKR